jgi:predicted 2-oxoglutarate/Fe(II)-dependent dioxygenase YbiX
VQAVDGTFHARPDGARVHYERRRPEQTTLYRLVQQHAANFSAQVQETTGAGVPQFVKDEFDAYLDAASSRTGF